MAGARSGRIVVVEAGVPDPTRDAGSRVVIDLVAGLRHLGFSVELVTEDNPQEVETAIGHSPEMVVLSRPGTFQRTISKVNRARTKVVYLAHDLHYLRLESGEGKRPGHSPLSAKAMKILERGCFHQADLTLVPTREEAQNVMLECPGANVLALNYYWFPPPPVRKGAPDNQQIVFLGSSSHGPNIDGVHWFLEAVWAELELQVPAAELLIVGDWPPSLLDSAPPRVKLIHQPANDELDYLLREARAGVAPLRFGAGMKRKTLHYLSQALPVVSTTFGVQGFAAEENESGVVVATTVDEWLSALLAVLGDNDFWQRQSEKATSFIATNFSHSRYLNGVAQALEAVSVRGHS